MYTLYMYIHIHFQGVRNCINNKASKICMCDAHFIAIRGRLGKRQMGREIGEGHRSCLTLESGIGSGEGSVEEQIPKQAGE